MQTPRYTVTVPSATHPGRAYVVAVFADGDTRCTCPDATYRHRQCKHGRQVVAGAVPAPADARTLAERYDAAYDRANVARILGGA